MGALLKVQPQEGARTLRTGRARPPRPPPGRAQGLPTQALAVGSGDLACRLDPQWSACSQHDPTTGAADVTCLADTFCAVTCLRTASLCQEMPGVEPNIFTQPVGVTQAPGRAVWNGR